MDVLAKKMVLSLVSVLLLVGGSATFLRTAEAAGGDPVISGTGRVGDPLTIASYGSLAGGPNDFTYTWLWEGEEVPGPGDYDASHIVTEDDLDHEVSVLVKPKRANAERLASNRVVATAAPLISPDVTIAGTAIVGRTLSATLSGGTPDASVAVQWLRDGAAVPGATALSYRVAKADGGRMLSVRVTSNRPGQAPAVRDSAARGIAAFNAVRPKLKGTAKIGRTLKVKSRGTWYAPGHRFSYQWMRNGSKIAGATKTSYKLRAKDRGKRITVVVRAKKSGFPTVSASSSRSGKIR